MPNKKAEKINPGKSNIRSAVERHLTPKLIYWVSRAAILLIVLIITLMAWPAFYTDYWADTADGDDYLPIRLREGELYVQPFTPNESGFSAVSVLFDPPIDLDNPEDVQLTMQFFLSGQAEPEFSAVLAGEDINRFTSTIIPVQVSQYEPGQQLELHLTVDKLAPTDLLAIHTVSVSENRLRVNGQAKGVALAMLLTYTRFDMSGLLLSISLILLILVLLFVPVTYLRIAFRKVPLLPVFLAPAFSVIVIELLNTLNEDALLPPVLIVLSYMLILLCQFALIALIRNTRLAIHIIFLICGGLAVTNHMKQFFRGDPLFAGDITSVSMLLSRVNQIGYMANVSFSYIVHVRFLQAVLVTLIFLIVISYMDKQTLVRDLRYRIGMFLTAMLAVVFLSSQVVLNDTLMITTFNVSKYPWNQMMHYKNNGFVVPFVHSVSDLIIRRPNMLEPFPEDFYLVSEQSMIPDPDQPNIIVVMSESYCDFENIRPINPSEPVMPYFDELRASDRTLSGNLLIPVFGGGSCNTEFEYLTGGSMIFFRDSSIPYLLHFRKPVHGLPDLLSQQGYRSVAIHPYLRSFWNRQSVYPAMGFDDFISLEDFPESDPLPNFVSDQVNFEQIVGQLESKDPHERLFIFSVTMQNHFPYYSTDENHSKLNYHIKLPEFADAESVELYLSMIRESDDALRYLVAYLEQMDEPTMLVFFGDHLPGNNYWFNSFYEALFGKTIADLDLEETRKMYETPYLIWANYGLPETEVISLMSPNFLALLTLDLAGIERSPYFDYIASINETIEAVSTSMLVMKNGRSYDRDSIPQSIVRQLDRYWACQYDNVIKPIEP